MTTGSGEGSAAGQVSVEALWAAPRWGLAAATGPAVGWVTGDPAAVTAWRARFRGWWQNLPGRLQLAGSVEPNWFLGSRFTDFSAGVAARSPRLEVGLSGSARLKTDTLAAAALATVELRMLRRVTFEVAAGNVLADPYQALPASRFLTIGVRFHFSPRTRQPDVVVRSKSFSAFRRGNEVLVRVRQRDAQLVAIAGDWNGWTPQPLERVGGDLWESSYPLGPGLHQFTVFIDGVAWRIPEGVPSVPDGMGGRVAVLSVF